MESKQTPMMRQYDEIKKQHPGEVVVFRLGDFYEMFKEDAVECSKILQLTLTKRGDIPMCGIPYHARKNYFYKLIQQGKKIALVEQIPSQRANTSLMERRVVEIITAATTVDWENLDENSYNYLASLHLDDSRPSETLLSFGAVDISTGNFECYCEKTKDIKNSIYNFIGIYRPKELLVSSNYKMLLGERFFSNQNLALTTLSPYLAKRENCIEIIKENYKLESLKSLGVDTYPNLVFSIAPLLHHLKENHQKNELKHIKLPRLIEKGVSMLLDHSTLKNLEVIQNNHDGGVQNTLFSAVDHTLSSIGKRTLKDYLVKPLLDKALILDRQNKVSSLVERPRFLEDVREQLKEVYDFNRLCSKISLGRILPKEIINLGSSLKSCIVIIRRCLSEPYPLFTPRQLTVLEECVGEIGRLLLEDPHNDLSEGGYINPLCSETLKRQIDAGTQGRNWLLDLLSKEKEKTGIAGLKIKYVENSGYFFVLTPQQEKNPPPHFILKKGMASGSRYVSAELLALQEEILEAREQSIKIEMFLFEGLVSFLSDRLSVVQEVSEEIGRLDVYQCFATLALYHHYVKPTFVDEGVFRIVDGRHPVVEKKVEHFIGNSLVMNSQSHLHILTGPNMAGKSTYLRQNALIILLAQIGSFVPAKEVSIPIVDRIFTRIGASDNLSEGQSTFLVEMSETAYILNQATAKSFIIMDEIGRGTSTYDGIAIASAILKYIVDRVGCYTLFATHYHELHALNRHPHIRNYTMSIEERQGSLTFLRKVVPGEGNNSYGIHIAKLSGLPKEVIFNAYQSFNLVENALKPKDDSPLNLFDALPSPLLQEAVDEMSEKERAVLDSIKSFDLNRATPMDTMQFVNRLKKQLEDDSH